MEVQDAETGLSSKLNTKVLGHEQMGNYGTPKVEALTKLHKRAEDVEQLRDSLNAVLTDLIKGEQAREEVRQDELSREQFAWRREWLNERFERERKEVHMSLMPFTSFIAYC